METTTIKNLKITFIGAGKMATAIGGGLIRSGKYSKEQFSASDKHGASREYFIQHSQIERVVEDNITAITGCDVVILAVKP